MGSEHLGTPSVFIEYFLNTQVCSGRTDSANISHNYALIPIIKRPVCTGLLLVGRFSDGRNDLSFYRGRPSSKFSYQTLRVVVRLTLYVRRSCD